MKALRTTSIVLFVVAVLCFFAGLTASKNAEEAAARNTDNIRVEVVEKKCSYDPDASPYINGCYYIRLTFKIANGTGVSWSNLNVTTYVYDRNGTSLGTITSSFGGTSGFPIGIGQTVTVNSEIKANQPDDFFVALYNTPLSDLVFRSEVTSGTDIRN